MKYLLMVLLISGSFFQIKSGPMDHFADMDTSYEGLLKDKLGELKNADPNGMDASKILANSKTGKTGKSGSGLDEYYLFASMFWGMIATGYFLWGKKAVRAEGMILGVLIAICSYMGTALQMTLICSAMIFCVHYFDIRIG